MSEQRRVAEPRKRVLLDDDDRLRIQPPATGTDTVVVGSKLPNGLIMHVDKMVEREVFSQGSRWIEKTAIQDGETYTLHGNAINMGAMAAGQPPEHVIIGGFALTPGIPRDFWERWAATTGADFVKRGIVFAASNEARARSQASERRDLKSGLEPIDPSNPGPRAGLRKGAVETASVTEA